jgi:hypothetical protein
MKDKWRIDFDHHRPTNFGGDFAGFFFAECILVGRDRDLIATQYLKSLVTDDGLFLFQAVLLDDRGNLLFVPYDFDQLSLGTRQPAAVFVDQCQGGRD